ncbi:MAG: acylhydrolase [Lachnospiraceae bacterium]|nr:acylhydrolase [Lachnospiraceae bacterium]
MNKYKNYIFVCLLLVGGLVFFAYEDAWKHYRERMQEAFEENVEIWAESVSDNHMTSVSENAFISTETVSDNEAAANEKEVVYTTVDESYFNDAVFIGDSRTVSLYDYAGLENTDFFASSGLTIYKLFEEPDGKFKDGNWTENIETSLQKKQYKKIYFMIGINEMGTGDVDYFMEHYAAAVARMRQLQPDAIIYLQGIMHVTMERSAEGDYIHNEGIMERNERIARLADNETVFYLDVNSVVCDESGGLNPQYTFDGVHLYAQYVHIWTEYLMEHAVKE